MQFYLRIIDSKKRARRDLNPRHPEPESGALSPELRALISHFNTFWDDVG